ncbi:MAG TPA: ABC transporter permease [Roseiflexaceae bacterium]|nr:ABC transporter permease [Roseiflexaceae bacterium]
MSRFATTLRADVVLQARNGFYAATAFVTAIWALLLLGAGGLDLRWLLPPMLLGNLLLGTFYFIAGLVLLERAEGSLVARAITPLRPGEYLAAKVLSLSALALAETLALTPLMAGWRFLALPLAAGVMLGAAVYCLAGFVAVSRYRAINEYLMPSTLYVTLLWLPLLAYTVQWRPWPLLLHPLSGPLALVEAAFAPAESTQLLYGLAASALWVAMLGVWAQKRLESTAR